MDSRKGRPTRKQPRRKKTQFPLDPALLAQRGLADSGDEPLPAVRIKSATKNPTIFRKRIADVDAQAGHGDLVRVLDDSGGLVGCGIWNPRAEATVRLLEWGAERIDDSWWTKKLAAAVQMRSEFLRINHADGEETSAYRMVNAEGDGLPGLVADLYGEILSIEAFSLGMYQRSGAIAERLASLCGAKHWVVRPGPATLEQEGFAADGFESGSTPEKVKIVEHGVEYEIHPFGGHKTGFFCDQRDNRQKLRAYCRGQSVLDLCCYSGGFALNAMAAGAAEVTAVDLDEDAVQMTKRNAKLNRTSFRAVHADAFAYMRDMQRNGKTYGVVILDPPKLIRNRDEASEGQSTYYDMNRLAASLVAPGGLLLTCSCSGLLSMEEFIRTVRAATADRRPQLLARTGAAADHPVSMGSLESEYLKCLWLRMQ